MPLSSSDSNHLYLRRAAALPLAGLLLLISSCSVFGGASVEEAPYQLVQKDEQFEVRDYSPVIVAQTQVSGNLSNREAGSQAFRKLFNYISGENEAQEEIAMTAPVISESTTAETVPESDTSEKIAMTAPVMFEKEDDAWRYRFVLPESFTMDTAPRPLNPDVSILQTEPRRVATITYSGLGRDKARAQNTKALLEWVESQGFEVLSSPQWAGYNPPWTLPPFRRNEVMVEIASQ